MRFCLVIFIAPVYFLATANSYIMLLPRQHTCVMQLYLHHVVLQLYLSALSEHPENLTEQHTCFL